MNGKHSGRAPDDPRRMDGVWPRLGSAGNYMYIQ